jgi:hypothetical protein
VALDLGSSGLLTGAWTATMLTRYPAYALGRDGTRLKNDRYFGYDEQGVQREYQRRTGQPQTGRVSDDDLHRLGLLPSLITTHGTGQPDPFGIGYPADMARRLLHLYRWKPVGNYPAIAVPMDDSADAGEREINRFIDDPFIVPSVTAWIDFSQGSICAGRVRNRIRAGKARHEVTILGGVTFGNPMRPDGSYAGNVDPGTGGLDPTLETATEPGLIHMAAKGDMYTARAKGNAGEFQRAIFLLVFKRIGGVDGLVEQFGELFTNPWIEIPAAINAMLKAGMFFAKGTGPHVRYHVDQCPGTGQTYYEYGIQHLEQLATARLQRIVDQAKSA